MSLTENKIISQITSLPDSSAFNVQWTNQIIKNGEIIAKTYERKSYTKEQKDEFISEVDNAQFYIQAIGWTN